VSSTPPPSAASFDSLRASATAAPSYGDRTATTVVCANGGTEGTEQRGTYRNGRLAAGEIEPGPSCHECGAPTGEDEPLCITCENDMARDVAADAAMEEWEGA
jgi:hypothetical protein